MKNQFILWLFIPISFLFSQEIQIIKGKIVSKENTLPIYLASIELKNSKNQILEKTLSNKEGFFILSIQPKTSYLLELSFPGFELYQKNIFLDSKASSLDLGEIFLTKKDASPLEEVVVRAPSKTTITNKIDKKIIHVGEDLLSSSTTTDQLLNRLPSLRVDPQKGDLSLQGEDVEVYLDGKPTNIPISQLIKQLPVNAIEKIELISNPSAKYEATGAGIVNIILKKGSRKKAYQVSLNSSSQYGRTLRHNNNLSGNLNLGKFNFFTTYSQTPGRRNILISQELITQRRSIRQSSYSNLNAHSLKYGLDYFIDKKNELTLSSTFFLEDSTGELFNVSEHQKTHLLNQTSKNKSSQFEYDLNYRHKFDQKDHELSFDARYSHSKDRNAYDIFVPKNEDTNQENSNRLLIKTDYVLPISDKSQLEAGGQYRRNYLASNYHNLTSGQKINFLFKRDVYTTYLTFSKEINKLGLKLGLRGEYTLDEIKNKNPTKNKYPDLFPSVFFNYNLNKKNTFSLSYSKRIRRPKPSSISPIRRFQTDNFRFEGNEDLRPSYPHSVSFSYLYNNKGNSINASFFYRFIKNPLVFITDVDPTNNLIFIGRMGNYGKATHGGFEISSSYKLAKFWDLNASFDIYQNRQSGFRNLPTQSFIQSNLRGNNIFKLTKKLSLQLSGTYHAPEKNLQGSTESRASIDLALSRHVFGDKGTISLNIFDLFKQNTYRGFLETQGVKRKFCNDWETRFISMAFSYSFGGKIQKRQIKDDPEDSSERGSMTGM